MATANTPPLDLRHVQGDILAGLPKKTQTYFFFQIKQARVHEFRVQLNRLVPLITSTAQVIEDKGRIAEHKSRVAEAKRNAPLLEIVGVNVVFSQKGLLLLGIKDKIGDAAFEGGMLADAQNLGDPGTTASGKFNPKWDLAFKEDIHGMFLVSGDSHETVLKQLSRVEQIFLVGTPEATIHEVTRLVGDVRKGENKGHEHFGFLDGISQPAVQGVDNHPNPGQETVRQGVFLMGRLGDKPGPSVTSRPHWALDGSLLAFRYLPQLVPEFNKFLKDHPIAGLPAHEGSELLGARLVGRWKSGAPVDTNPIHDNPKAGADDNVNNNFRYDFPDDVKTQTRCPFAAHTRKTNPRADLEDLGFPTASRRILRRGIQFGPEVSPAEERSSKTTQERGLLFAAYQSNIVNGFQFIQESWANNTKFPIQKDPVVPGFDAIIGQTNTAGVVREMSGSDPDPLSQGDNLDLGAQWVVPKGGEYFFSPSIPVLKETFALAK